MSALQRSCYTTHNDCSHSGCFGPIYSYQCYSDCDTVPEFNRLGKIQELYMYLTSLVLDTTKTCTMHTKSMMQYSKKMNNYHKIFNMNTGAYICIIHSMHVLSCVCSPCVTRSEDQRGERIHAKACTYIPTIYNFVNLIKMCY